MWLIVCTIAVSQYNICGQEIYREHYPEAFPEECQMRGICDEETNQDTKHHNLL